MFTTIKKWDLCYIVIASTLTVSIDCSLKSTSTDQELWKYNGTIVVDLSGGNAGGGIAGLIASAVVTAVNSAIADYVPYARQANYSALHSLPYGKYHPQHNKDQNMKFIDQTPKRKANHDRHQLIRRNQTAGHSGPERIPPLFIFCAGSVCRSQVKFSGTVISDKKTDTL